MTYRYMTDDQVGPAARRYLERMHALGVFAEADEWFDAIDRGEDPADLGDWRDT